MTQAIQKIVYTPISVTSGNHVDIGPSTANNAQQQSQPGSPGMCKYALRGLLLLGGASGGTFQIDDTNGTTNNNLMPASPLAANTPIALSVDSALKYTETVTVGNAMRLSCTAGAVSGFAVVESTGITYN